MASKKTWIWILVAFLGLCVVGLFAVAGLGIYFVTSYVDTGHTSSADALRRFDGIRSGFEEQRPLFELDSDERPRIVRPVHELPSSPRRPNELRIMAWDPDRERLSSITLPFWILRLGRKNIDIRHDGGFDLEQLNLDVDELERIGPVLVFDLRTHDGERVLVWTQ